MTAVVGILNKRGIAIAADSAVTITHERKQKIENSANKMLRMSDVSSISIMIVGSAVFLNTPWDIIVRRYRQKRGNRPLPTVQACIDDFFSYMTTEKMFLSEEEQKDYLNYYLRRFWDKVVCAIPRIKLDQKKVIQNKEQIIRAFRTRINSGIRYFQKSEIIPAFKNYPIEQFEEYLGTMVDELFKMKTVNINTSFIDKDNIQSKKYPENILSEIKKQFIEGLYCYLTYGWADGDTQLIFSGYGDEEEYPVMIRVMVNHGFDNRICHYIFPEDVHVISETNPVAICPYAQADIMEAILTGVNPESYHDICDHSGEMFKEIIDNISSGYMFEEGYKEIKAILKKVKSGDLIHQFKHYAKSIRESERRQWLKALHNYSLQDMAHLAENLIAMTSFERHMTFSQEGVGGPIDLAVISKNSGFIWLNRKSWYHHKDVGGRYGKFGV